MKTVFYLMAVIGLVLTASADPVRYEWRSFGNASVDLQPLFTWWVYASQTTNPPMDITELNGVKLGMMSNIWQRMPPKPLPEWFRVEASERQITVVGSMWKVDATIEAAPMMLRREVIYLQDPPVKEIQNFKLARNAYTALQNAQNNDVASADAMKNNIQAEAAAMLETNSQFYAGVAHPNIAAGSKVLQQDSVTTASNLNTVQSRTLSRDAQMAALQRYLSAFPDENTYWLDHFALRTSKVVDGLQVYDMGIAQGLTY